MIVWKPCLEGKTENPAQNKYVDPELVTVFREDS